MGDVMVFGFSADPLLALRIILKGASLPQLARRAGQSATELPGRNGGFAFGIPSGVAARHNRPMSQAKRAAGILAAQQVESGQALGLGTGSTVEPFLDELARRVRDEGLRVRGVPTSQRTERRARELGIEIASLEQLPSLDLCIDGADEIDPKLRMIKGGGGALLREKVVARSAARMLIVVDESKCVDRLGTTFALPIEVVPFALPLVRRELGDFGAQLVLRQDAGEEYRTDNGNAILDARFPDGIEDPERIERMMGEVPGVVCVGLFLGLADGRVVGRADGTAGLAWA